MPKNIRILKKQSKPEGVKYFIQNWDDNGVDTILEISKSKFMQYQLNNSEMKMFTEKCYYYSQAPEF